jgi:hypothetical protein
MTVLDWPIHTCSGAMLCTLYFEGTFVEEHRGPWRRYVVA